MRRVIRRPVLMIIIMALMVSLLHVSSSNAGETAQAVFDEANDYFLHKQYDEARTDYEKLLRMGFKDPSVYFNLSNTYMLLNDPGKAALYLYRAKRLQPRNEDIKKNLIALQSIVERDLAHGDRGVIVNSRTDGDAGDLDAEFTLKGYVRSFPMTKNEVSVAILVLYLLFFSWSLLRKLLKTGYAKFLAFSAALLSYIFTLFFIIVFVSSFYYESFHPEAVVLETVEMRSSPSEDDSFRNGIVIYGGTLVDTVRVYNGWGEVTSRAGDVTGWIKEEFLGNI